MNPYNKYYEKIQVYEFESNEKFECHDSIFIVIDTIAYIKKKIFI